MRIKAILLGDSGVGKSTLLSCIRPNHNSIPTIGIDCLLHNNVQFWDTSGDKRFTSVLDTLYETMDVAIFVYNSLDTLSNIEMYRRKFCNNRVRFILVYNGNNKNEADNGRMYSIMYNMWYLQGNFKLLKEAERVLNKITNSIKLSIKKIPIVQNGIPIVQNGWRYCWFY